MPWRNGYLFSGDIVYNLFFSFIHISKILADIFITYLSTKIKGLQPLAWHIKTVFENVYVYHCGHGSGLCFVLCLIHNFYHIFKEYRITCHMYLCICEKSLSLWYIKVLDWYCPDKSQLRINQSTLSTLSIMSTNC